MTPCGRSLLFVGHDFTVELGSIDRELPRMRSAVRPMPEIAEFINERWTKPTLKSGTT
jgi:hypothetical protein